ncbi:hypothetical protein QQS21_011424 [Conoideocrella luteorostrata]|uniref:Nephrocystin 3-like N-terminal domain-containing protein n=1 Tax=Conoideocrella luteorostrata TaxID=1105319 RepID=A0AAJ0CFV7_9HYPO|nr:hypothetical protein QQS21_011424 [Conoideocrella luteorostrata]
MSIAGLLRSLIYLVLRQCPNLISLSNPERWEALYLVAFSAKRFSHLRFFFLIDGLDEFIGDRIELMELIQELAACEHIKVCVASRLWANFQKFFDKLPSLVLQQHLTTKDLVE